MDAAAIGDLHLSWEVHGHGKDLQTDGNILFPVLRYNMLWKTVCCRCHRTAFNVCLACSAHVPGCHVAQAVQHSCQQEGSHGSLQNIVDTGVHPHYSSQLYRINNCASTT